MFNFMRAAGVIVTYIDWSNIKELPFNIVLFVFQLLFLIVGKILGKVEVEWSEIWHAAQASHVRLCLRKKPKHEWLFAQLPEWEYINFGYPKAEIQTWNMDMIDGKRFRYFDPTFDPSPVFIEKMIGYAEDQVGKRYDELQLISCAVNLPIWILYWPWWGQEKIKWFNRPGGLEHCTSGLVADLRWAEGALRRVKTIFFKIYHTAVVPPCLVELSENWRGR